MMNKSQSRHSHRVLKSNGSYSRRVAAVKFANAVNKVEGASVSSYANELSNQWVKGKISGTEMKRRLIEKHRNLSLITE